MSGSKQHAMVATPASIRTSPGTTAPFGLRATSKIRDIHLDRLAIVYVRQSSPQQVMEIARTKMNDLNAKDEEHAARMVEGTARSMGIEVVD